MDIGIADVIDERAEARKPRKAPTLTGGPGSGQNGGRRNPGGGGSGGDNGDQPDGGPSSSQQRFAPERSRILTGFLLLIVMMTFGGLLSAYVVIATNNVAEWRPFSLPVQVWISTAIILISSITYHLAKRSIDDNRQIAAKNWLIATSILGAAFISSQMIAWVVLSSRGLYMSGNPYAGFFYIITAVHAVHVLGGITALGSVLVRSWYPTENLVEILRRRSLTQVVGWYWHFMGLLWIIIFVLLGFWK